jgi:hypothetical protein
MTTAQEVEDWRVKIKKKIWSEFAAEPNEAHGKFLMKKFDELCDTALFGISINSQTTEGTDARELDIKRRAIAMGGISVQHLDEMRETAANYERLWKTSVAQTREECAKVCEKQPNTLGVSNEYLRGLREGIEDRAAAIRALKETK